MTVAIGLIAVNAALARTEDQAMPSPCLSVCRMDPASALCEGCLRTLDEIARWSGMSDAAKRVVWQDIGQRLQDRSTA